MTTKRIVYERPDGGVSIIIPAPSYVQEQMATGKTEDEVMAEIALKDIPSDAVKFEITDVTKIPVDRESRARWRLS